MLLHQPGAVQLDSCSHIAAATSRVVHAVLALLLAASLSAQGLARRLNEAECFDEH
jgi:hypothetical protein